MAIVTMQHAEAELLHNVDVSADSLVPPSPSREHTSTVAGCSLLLSVVVPIKNRSEQLQALFLALSRQTLRQNQFEVLICDDGSDVNPAGQTTLVCNGMDVRFLRQEARGAAAARNMGLRSAQGDFVAFTDSDCLPEPHWLEKIVEAFKNQRVDLIGGFVDHREAKYFTGRCVNFLMSSSFGAAGARNPNALIHMEYYPRTCNLAVRRNVALAVHGFPENEFGEDLEFSHRVKAQGGEVRFLAEAAVHHNEMRKPREILIRYYQRGITRMRLSRELGMHESIHALPAALVIYLCVVFVSIALVPRLWAFLCIPAGIYSTGLIFLGIHGALALRSVTAIAVVPMFAFLMHTAYGLGYLKAVLSRRS